MRRRHELPFGAELHRRRRALPAVGAARHGVALELEGAKRPARSPMAARSADGWFSRDDRRGGPGTRYRYRVDGTGAFPTRPRAISPKACTARARSSTPPPTLARADWRGRAWEEIGHLRAASRHVFRERRFRRRDRASRSSASTLGVDRGRADADRRVPGAAQLGL